MNKTAVILFQILCLTVFVSARTAIRERRDTDYDIDETLNKVDQELQGFVKQFWGGKCVTDDQCMKYISYCDKDAGVSKQFLGSLAVDGQCRPNFWIWLVLAAIVLFFLGACICCICCGLCKCLYNCLCCCCRDKGYTPANTHG